MGKQNKLKSKLLSLLCSVGALSGVSNSKTNGGFLDFLNGFNAFSKGVNNIANMGWGIKTLLKAQKHNSKNRKFPWNSELSPELFERSAAEKYGFTTTFDDAMSLMIGRSKQKEILRNLSVKHLVKNIMNIKKNITVVMAYGQSGTGKSRLIDLWERLFIANGFGNSFSNMPHNPPGPCRIRPADIDFANKKVSFWNQLLENKKMSMGNDVPVRSELVAYVEENPNGGIIDIDEADKFMDKSVQEGLRAIIDEGVLRADGIAYPLNNYIIVIKGNMSPSSVLGKDELLTENDIQSGLTSIDISQSLTKRIELVPFESYSAQELFSIFMSKLAKWEEQYRDVGLKVNVSDETRTQLGKFLSNNQMQGRGADKLFNDLTPQLYEIGKTLSNKSKTENKGKTAKTYNLLFDEASEALYLQETVATTGADYTSLISKLSEWKKQYATCDLTINIPAEIEKDLKLYFSNNADDVQLAEKLYNELMPSLYNIDKKLSTNNYRDRHFVYDLLFDHATGSLYLNDNSNLSHTRVSTSASRESSSRENESLVDSSKDHDKRKRINDIRREKQTRGKINLPIETRPPSARRADSATYVFEPLDAAHEVSVE